MDRTQEMIDAINSANLSGWVDSTDLSPDSKSWLSPNIVTIESYVSHQGYSGAAFRFYLRDAQKRLSYHL